MNYVFPVSISKRFLIQELIKSLCQYLKNLLSGITICFKLRAYNFFLFNITELNTCGLPKNTHASSWFYDDVLVMVKTK